MRILLVGSVNIDIFVDSLGQEWGVDRRGKFSLSIGGTASNVAVNLSELRKSIKSDLSIEMITALRKDSIFTDIALEKLRTVGVDSIGVMPVNFESAFFAYRTKGELKVAVNSTPIEKLVINAPLDGVDVLFLDFNNSIGTINNLVMKGFKHGTRIYTNLTSESKATKILKTPINFFTAIFCKSNSSDMPYFSLTGLIKVFNMFFMLPLSMASDGTLRCPDYGQTLEPSSFIL